MRQPRGCRVDFSTYGKKTRLAQCLEEMEQCAVAETGRADRALLSKGGTQALCLDEVGDVMLVRIARFSPRFDESAHQLIYYMNSMAQDTPALREPLGANAPCS